MKVGIKGKGAEIKWIDETELPVYEEVARLEEIVKKQNEFIENKFIDINKRVNAILSKAIEDYLKRGFE